jgi:hypothetical protein
MTVTEADAEPEPLFVVVKVAVLLYVHVLLIHSLQDGLVGHMVSIFAGHRLVPR